MTIGSSTPRVSFTCDGVSTVFPIPIQAYQAADIEVIHTTAAGVETVLVLNSDYSMAASGTLNPQQWTLTTLTASPYPIGDSLQAFINPVQNQQTNYVQGQAFPSLAVVTNMDRLTQMVQRLQDQVNRAVLAPDGDVSPGMMLPAAVNRALTYQAYDANGNTLCTPALPGTQNTQASLGPILNPRTGAEIAAGVTPTNYAYAAGDGRRYGTDPSGVSNSAAAIISCLAQSAQTGGAAAFFIAGTYKIGATLGVIPAKVRIVGSGRDNTIFSKQFNGDLAQLADGVDISDIKLIGNGGTYTGRGFYISGTDGNQTLRDIRIIDFASACLDFTATTAGSRISVDNAELWCTAGSTGSGKYAVTVQDASQLSAVPRKFTKIETAGFCFIQLGGCNDLFLDDSFVGDVLFSANSRGVNFGQVRIANQAAMTVDGHNNSLVGCDINPQITVAAGADAITIGPGSFNNLPIIDNSGNPRNNITHWAIPYTPTLSTGGTAPSLGNGTLTGSYERQGAAISFTINFTVGSTTTLGTGDIRFSLPVARSSGDIPEPAVLVTNHSGTINTAVGQIPGAVSYVTFVRDTSGAVTFNSPQTWAAGDTFRITGTYNL